MMKNLNRVVGLDIDGVVCDYLGGFWKFAERKGLRPACPAHEEDTWALSRGFPHIQNDELEAAIAEFSEHPDFATLEFVEGARETMLELRNKYGGLRYVAITSAGLSPATERLRRENLSSLPFSEVHVLGRSSSKSSRLRGLPPGSAYVDDLKEHVDEAERHGLVGILMGRPHNRGLAHPRRAEGWREVATHIEMVLAKT